MLASIEFIYLLFVNQYIVCVALKGYMCVGLLDKSLLYLQLLRSFQVHFTLLYTWQNACKMPWSISHQFAPECSVTCVCEFFSACHSEEADACWLPYRLVFKPQHGEFSSLATFKITFWFALVWVRNLLFLCQEFYFSDAKLLIMREFKVHRFWEKKTYAELNLQKFDLFPH